MTGFGTMRMIEREKPERTAAGMDAYGAKPVRRFWPVRLRLRFARYENIRQRGKQYGAARTFIRAAPFACLLSRSGDKNRCMTMRPCFEVCKQPQVNTMNNPKLGLFNLLTPMEIATEALFHHTKEEMKGGKPKSASSRLCSASE